ncbi:hypothetical protein [Streptomyces sp. CB01881]|uniref:hypothetical protein n=1 Tax=Streptomyces sp. CB01881 TaxID=2078691 RepID=UPI000CDC3A54|nr:hypothetical protein [Streptomyces sp. CB01881]AUY50912.1 hypothetical protein C2142_20425 [Streptomyces sp. CB01881]TYC74295.1 hypothetical protein EH183_20390 [Streptomyces sp. CB01881]
MQKRSVVALTAAVLVGVGAVATPAWADGGSGGTGGSAASDVPDYGAAQQVLRSGQTQTTVSRFLGAAKNAATPGGGGTGADGGATGARPNAPKAAGAPSFELKDPVPLYELAPDFVSGKAQPAAQNALSLSYLASRVNAADGHQAAVLLAPQPKGGSGWQLAGIRDGDSEVKLAEGATAGARTFSESQIHAWYRLTPSGDVVPLNSEATKGLGGKQSVTLAAYQKLVSGRYADKQPGSGYDQKGLAGGFGLADAQAAAGAQTVAEPVADAQPVVEAQPVASAESHSAGAWQAAVVGAAVVVAGGGIYLRRRRAADR